jgi:hypothetical protein
MHALQSWHMWSTSSTGKGMRSSSSRTVHTSLLLMPQNLCPHHNQVHGMNMHA